MGRRRKSSSDEGVNLDSLMDALTNVVAVLILVLLLVQADVSQKVVQFLEGLLPATEEEVAASEEKAKELESDKIILETMLTKEPPKPEDVEAEKRQLALLEKNVKTNEELLADLEQLKKLEKKSRKERDDEAKKTKGIQDEIARLEALLDKTPVLKVDPTVVGIPASRPVPKSAEIYHALVINERVHFIDPFTPLKMFEDEFRQEKRNFPNERIKRQGADRYIYRSGPILKHYEKFDFKNSRNQKVKLVANPVSTRMQLVVSPDLKEGGTSLEELKEKDSNFAKIVYKLSSNIRSVLMFHVHPNSFNTYLQARRVTDKARVSAGWEVKGMGAYYIRIDDVEIRREKEPPPAPTKPGPERPPTLPPKID